MVPGLARQVPGVAPAPQEDHAARVAGVGPGQRASRSTSATHARRRGDGALDHAHVVVVGPRQARQAVVAAHRAHQRLLDDADRPARARRAGGSRGPRRWPASRRSRRPRLEDLAPHHHRGRHQRRLRSTQRSTMPSSGMQFAAPEQLDRRGARRPCAPRRTGPCRSRGAPPATRAGRRRLRPAATRRRCRAARGSGRARVRMPWLRAAETPPLSCQHVADAVAERARRWPSPVPSVEPSSTTMISCTGRVCASTDVERAQHQLAPVVGRYDHRNLDVLSHAFRSGEEAALWSAALLGLYHRLRNPAHADRDHVPSRARSGRSALGPAAIPDYTLRADLFARCLRFLRRALTTWSARTRCWRARRGERATAAACAVDHVRRRLGRQRRVRAAAPCARSAPGLLFVVSDAIDRRRRFYQEQIVVAWRLGRLDTATLSDSQRRVAIGGRGARAGDTTNASLRRLIGRIEQLPLRRASRVACRAGRMPGRPPSPHGHGRRTAHAVTTAASPSACMARPTHP